MFQKKVYSISRIDINLQSNVKWVTQQENFIFK